MCPYQVIIVSICSFMSCPNYIGSRSTNFNYRPQDPLISLRISPHVLYTNPVISGKCSIPLHFKSLCVFCFCYLFSTAYARLGLVRLNLVLKRCFTISSAGVTPVVLWGVVRYLTRNLASLCFIEIPCLPLTTCLTKASFTTLTDLCGVLFFLYFNAIYLFFILRNQDNSIPTFRKRCNNCGIIGHFVFRLVEAGEVNLQRWEADLVESEQDEKTLANEAIPSSSTAKKSATELFAYLHLVHRERRKSSGHKLILPLCVIP